MHSIELQRTMASVRETEQAIDVEQEAARSSNSCGRDALTAGDRLDWTAARSQVEIAEWKQERLEQVRLEREVVNDEARKQYIASRLRSEQMKHVVDGAAMQVEIKSGRQAQATLDDRFLARRRWTDAREGLRASSEIKTS